ncbi:MAG TPA: SAM-dependent methyltransferase [Polyangiales bacterium]|nr:SAM-dependent methyltransferase [Polyangiales bacterium]
MDGTASQAWTDDALTDRVRVSQRRGGHRYSFDDVITAWVAVRAVPEAKTYLDLGCGLGSVLLMVADRLVRTRALGIEAQTESFALARHNVSQSWLADRVLLRHGDLRDDAVCAQARGEFAALNSCADDWSGFDLITGTPPYKKPGTATPSPDPQRAHARIELRGGVEEYLAAAGRMLAPDGTFVVCMETPGIDRVRAGARAAGLHIVEQLDVIPIAVGKGRLFSVFALKRSESASPPIAAELLLRDSCGARTAAAIELRRFFGLEPRQTELPSPPRIVAALSLDGQAT